MVTTDPTWLVPFQALEQTKRGSENWTLSGTPRVLLAFQATVAN